MTLNRNMRRLTGTAAALGGLFLLAPAPASSAAEPAVLLERWTYDADSARLADGVAYFKYVEDPSKLVGRTTPRVLNIVRVAPDAGATRLETSFGQKGSGVPETVREQLDTSTPPLAGINAGFGSYDVRNDDVRSMMFNGISVRDGVINGVSCVFPKGQKDPASGKYTQVKEGMRAAVLQYGVPYMSLLKTELNMEIFEKNADGTDRTVASHRLDDVNRTPGRATGCARDLDDLNGEGKVTYGTNVPLPLFQDPDELVVFNGDYGIMTPSRNLDANAEVPGDNDTGVEIPVDGSGVIGAARTARGGHPVDRGAYAIQAIGTDATWLTTNATAGRHLRVVQKVVDLGAPPVKSAASPNVEQPRLVALDESTDIVSNVHWLVEDGKSNPNLTTCKRVYSVNNIAVKPEDERQPGDFCRDSRTAIGVDRAGATLFVTITGPRDAAAPPADDKEAEKLVDGAFMWEMRDVLLALHAQDAMNLDGGGSTTLITNGYRRTGLTDTTTAGGKKEWTEREVGDSVYVGKGGTPLP
ncbi:phosphodiester glycosidase family protein [Streptomyces sp. NPDC099050]|uniref:phosphodiester glycosidase family protein n=1 Tax=Streptomyces sp. NPDC099050 TaxID=3366100 RepID=UPI0037F80F98